ncbi:MAG: efflux RND transporter periplasmic adaptor subunit [Muribaculaceae bacterium]|nr:efflux RND transporter periplasmic adaptor subunit [Muribaculaceae bacterium]
MKTLTFAAFGAAVVFISACSHKETHTAETFPVDVAYPVVDSLTLYQSYPGTLGADNEVPLVARVNGYLTGQLYTNGQFVHKGDVLFTIESGNYRDAVQQAQSNLASAKSTLEYAQTRYEALKEALKTDAVSRMEVEQGLNTLEEAKASVKSAQAALQTAQTQLSYCTVRAPYDGHMSKCNFSVGAYVGGEGAPVTLATLYDDASMNATFAIDDAGALSNLLVNLEKNGMDYHKIPVSFSDTLAHEYTASLTYMAPKVNTSTGTLELQGRIENPYGELRSGMFVSVDLPTGTDPHAIIIRDAAISTDQLGKYVYVVNDSNKVVYTPITIGPLANDSMRIVTKGLSDKDKYVTKALLKVRNGITVKPVVKQ